MSLFLAEGIQLQSGKLVMASCRGARVGRVSSYEGGQLVAEEQLQLASQQVRCVARGRAAHSSA